MAAVGDADALLAACSRVRPDVPVTDIRMPPGNTDDGLCAALTVCATMPGVGVMVLSQFVHRRYAIELIGTDPAGVGYLLKQRIGEVERFCDAVKNVAGGGTVLDPEVVQIMMQKAHRAPGSVDRPTDRQAQVLALIAEGRSNAAIATRDGHTHRLVSVMDVVAEQLDRADPHQARVDALAVFGSLLGTLHLSRAISVEALSSEVLERGITAAPRLVGGRPAPPVRG